MRLILIWRPGAPPHVQLYKFSKIAFSREVAGSKTIVSYSLPHPKIFFNWYEWASSKIFYATNEKNFLTLNLHSFILLLQ